MSSKIAQTPDESVFLNESKAEAEQDLLQAMDNVLGTPVKDTQKLPQVKTAVGPIMHKEKMQDQRGNVETMDPRPPVRRNTSRIDDLNTDQFAKTSPLEDVFEQGANVKFIKEAHLKNDIKVNQHEQANDFMENVQYKVPLDDLYKVVASCNYVHGAKFCPVLVKIMDPDILKECNGKRWLLQVWTDKGDMIFERPMKNPVANWNITDNKFVFLEETHSTEIYLVKLFLDKQPVLFKFTLPQSVPKGQINSTFDDVEDNYVIPDEEDLGETDIHSSRMLNLRTLRESVSSSLLNDSGRSQRIHKQSNRSQSEDFEHMLKTGEIRAEDHFAENLQTNNQEKSVSQMFKNKIIMRGPDKMMDYIENYILIAYRYMIITIALHDAHVDGESPIDISDRIVEKVIDQKCINYLDLDHQHKIIMIQDLGSTTMSSIVLEDLLTRQIRFLRVQIPDPLSDKKAVKFVQLGLVANSSIMSPSPLLKFRTTTKTNPKTNKRYQVGLAVRENGRLEVYTDFILVNEFMNPRRQCVDIESGADKFYMKFVLKSDEIHSDTEFKQIKFEVRDVLHSERNRISYQTSQPVDHASEWNWAIHRRIAGYFKLYTRILNFSMYMLISHRNMISVYDMTSISATDKEDSEGKWVQTIRFSQGNIREMMIKKKTKEARAEEEAQNHRDIYGDQEHNIKRQDKLNVFEKFQIITLIGTHTFRYCVLSAEGQLSKSRAKATQAPGRVLSIQDDPNFKTGLLLLIDNEKDGNDYQMIDDCQLFTFPLKPQPSSNNAVVTLQSLKFNVFHELITSDHPDVRSLNHDSSFFVTLARKQIFLEQEKLEKDEVEDKVEKAFPDKDLITVIVIKSNLKQGKAQIFPIYKTRRDGSKIVDKIQLITNVIHRKEVQFEAKSPLINAFFTYSTAFKEDCRDNLAEVSENKISIYNKDQELRFSFKGGNIRSCQNIHQGYLYTISDNMTVAQTIEKFDDSQEETEEIVQDSNHFTDSGFYVYDLQQMFDGKIEKYKLSNAIGGQCSLVNSSKFSNRFSFLQSYDNIVVIPFPHLNTINFIGMGQKSDYLIWRAKNSFFTALDKTNMLYTWSMLSGKMLYLEKLKQQQTSNLEKYEVYRADDDDITYTQNFYNQAQSSISLLKSKIAINLETSDIIHDQKGLNCTKNALEKRILSTLNKNKKGVSFLGKGAKMLDGDLFKTNEEGLSVKVMNSQQKSNLYHFKVMELKVHEDTKQESELRVRFHFLFDMLKLKHEEKNKLSNFEWDIASNPVQRLYLSQDTMSMMEVINNIAAIVYTRVNVDEGGHTKHQDYSQSQDKGQQIKWKISYRISKFPSQLAAGTSVPFLFSPNFKYQFDVNVRARQFMILETKTQFVYQYIPLDLLMTQWKGRVGQNSIDLIMSRFKWVSDRQFRIINEENLDCLFEMVSTDSSDLKPEKRSIELLSAVKVDNLYENTLNLDSRHLHFQRKRLLDQDVLERLIRVNQAYKTDLQHALNTGDTSYKIEQSFNTMDYAQEWDNQSSSFDCELSFTYLDWRIQETINGSPDFGMADIDEEQKIQICFNILPKGRSVLHKLAIGNVNNSENDQIESYESCKELFEVAGVVSNLDITGVTKCSFEIPILPDVYGQTVLDYCLGQPFQKDKKGIYLEEEKAQSYENKPMAEYIFTKLKDYSFMHSSQFITNAVIEATSLGLPSMLQYFDSRLKKVSHTFEQKTQKSIKAEKTQESPAMGSYGMLVDTKIWTSEKEIQNKLFDQTAQQQPMALMYLDVPSIFGPTAEGFAFITALLDTPEKEIFGLKSVQIIIDSHHNYWYVRNLLYIGLPMLLQLLTFWYWSNIVMTNLDIDYDKYETHNTVCQIILTITAVYLLLLESTAIQIQGWDYLRDATRVLNLIVPVLNMANIYNTGKRNEKYFWTIQIFAALCIWLRSMLFLRNFEKFGWLIRIIIDSFLDMRYFLIVLFIGVFAFADAYLSINQKIALDQDQPETIQLSSETAATVDQVDAFDAYVEQIKVSFHVALGDFLIDLDNYDNTDFFIFMICVVFNIIVLLNLLIAIISETYDNVSTTKKLQTYFEKTNQLRYIMDTIYGYKKELSKPNELIFIAKVISNHQEEDEDTMPEEVRELHTNMKDFRKDFSQFQEEFRELSDLVKGKFQVVHEKIK